LTTYSREIINKNASIWLRVPPSSSLRSVMRSAPEQLVMNDSDLADTFVLMEPRLHFFATSRAQTYWAGEVATAERFKTYQCTKALLSRRTPGAISSATLSNLDRSFKYLNTDFPLLTLGRASALRDMFDPSEPAGACPHRALELFPALELGAKLPDDGLRSRLDEALRLNHAAAGGITTPSTRWSYAGDAKFNIGESRLVDVRVESRVDRGCLGVGVVKSDLMTYEVEKQLIPSGSTQTADLTFPAQRDDSYFFVVRNCSADGASSGAVETVQIFAVNAVSAAPL
jgi:hypothetical protein